jgi:hypothetical protein
MRRILFSVVAIAALALLLANPVQARASWLSEALHAYFDPPYTYDLYAAPGYYYGPTYQPAPAYGYTYYPTYSYMLLPDVRLHVLQGPVYYGWYGPRYYRGWYGPYRHYGYYGGGYRWHGGGYHWHGGHDHHH